MSNSSSNIDGNWKMVLSGDEDKAATCILIQAGNELTGTFQGPMGNLALTGSITNDVEIYFDDKFIMGNLKFSGTIDGDTMNGNVDFPMGKGRKKWAATKILNE